MSVKKSQQGDIEVEIGQTENNRVYQESDLVTVAKRENNSKRNYLIVNPKQGKHIPVSPTEAFLMYQKLANQLKKDYQGEKLLLIGFAETATAIGAAVAIELHSYYIQTTREEIPKVTWFSFSEVHSHAVQQKLVKEDLDFIIEDIDRIIFIEDEVTTGNTILNIVKKMQQAYSCKLAFSVASLLNGMEADALKRYKEKNIKLHYLVKINHFFFAEKAAQYQEDGKYVSVQYNHSPISVEKIEVFGFIDARRLVNAEEYKKACERVCMEVWKKLNLQNSIKKQEKIGVIGTEEFMYPALYFAKKIEEAGNFVRCHSTTRSPIAVSKKDEYPLHSRYELESIYEKGRRTFLYNIKQYDRVFIFTDAKKVNQEGENSLINALYQCGNQKISWIRWCEGEEFI